MSAPTLAPPAAPIAATPVITPDPFALTFTTVVDVPSGQAAAACATDDGCGSTCPSACSGSSV
ncbi:FxLD family lanthipeptide [Actinokineospora enzanensis]|uniref:FxLD family lanthipeptide n=1 Tax=Actinokineospora enzanensis TaxID=155975 RepID=UPI000360FBE3|nr:FxLD family lanthipeptide [Actinokineospora enzanensis]